MAAINDETCGPTGGQKGEERAWGKAEGRDLEVLKQDAGNHFLELQRHHRGFADDNGALLGIGEEISALAVGSICGDA